MYWGILFGWNDKSKCGWPIWKASLDVLIWKISPQSLWKFEKGTETFYESFCNFCILIFVIFAQILPGVQTIFNSSYFIQGMNKQFFFPPLADCMHLVLWGATEFMIDLPPSHSLIIHDLVPSPITIHWIESNKQKERKKTIVKKSLNFRTIKS